MKMMRIKRKMMNQKIKKYSMK